MNLLDRWLDWLGQQLPIQCPLCKEWVRKCDTREARHCLAGWVKVCKVCYRDLYGGEGGG